MKITYTAKEKESADYIKTEETPLMVADRLIKGCGEHNEPYVYEISVTNESDDKWAGIFHMEIGMPKNDPQYYLPAFMYGRNRGDEPIDGMKLYPRITDNISKPGSPIWKVRGDRLSHPVAMVYDNDKVIGISASPYRNDKLFRYSGFTLDNSGNECKVGYTLGYENYPWLFIESSVVVTDEPKDDNYFVIDAHETISFKVYIYEEKAEDERLINRIIENVYYRCHEEPIKKSSVKEAVSDIAGAISKYAWIEENKGYSLFVFDRGDEILRKLGSFSWTNGLSVAVPVLMSAIRLNDDAMKNQALCCINNIIHNSLNPLSSLPYDAYSDEGVWSVKGWWYNGMKTGGHSGYIVGQGLYYIMKAYEFVGVHCKKQYDEWLEYVKPVIEKLTHTANGEGEFPYILSAKTGAGLEYDSFGSSWIMTAIVYYMKITGDYTYLDMIKKSELHYYEEYVKKCICYGGPLDISKGVDSEGILAYIRAVMLLHMITKEDIYLEHLKDAIEYEFTFKFCYNSPVSIPPLSKTGWSSCGGSVTSVVNPHIHPMSSTVVDEMMYYVSQTDDEYIKSRINDVIMWGCQTYNYYDGEYDYGKKGWMSERYCYSQGLLTEKYEDGSPASTWFALMPWAGASIIEGMTGDAWKQQ